MENDKFFLARAFELARLGRFTTSPNPNVGCVIVRNGRIVGEGYHQRPGKAHAEICALKKAGKAARGATVYVTLEPCSHYGKTPPCTKALINAGVAKVVASMPDPNPEVAGLGFNQLKQAGIIVKHGLMLSKAEEINSGFLKRMRTGFPWIRIKLALSLDGRTAMASGESRWITSSEARQDVQSWRAESDAILSTASTVLEDDPALTVRWSSLPKEIQELYPQEELHQPARIIIDSANRVKPIHRVIQEEGRVYLVRLSSDDQMWPASVRQMTIPVKTGSINPHLDLVILMLQLGRLQINNLLVEAGASLSGALLDAGLVDELLLYQAPKLLGTDAKPLFLISKLKVLDMVPEFKLIEIKKIGPDIRLRLKPTRHI